MGDRLRKGLPEDDLVALGEEAIDLAARLAQDEPDHEKLLVAVCLLLQLLSRNVGMEKCEVANGVASLARSAMTPTMVRILLEREDG